MINFILQEVNSVHKHNATMSTVVTQRRDPLFEFPAQRHNLIWGWFSRVQNLLSNSDTSWVSNHALQRGVGRQERTEEVVFNWTLTKICTVSLILAPGRLNTNEWGKCIGTTKQYRWGQLCGDSDWWDVP